MPSQGELRCFCARSPLLAVYGRDTQTGHPFVHVKVWKGKRLYTEMVATGGIVRLRCRECLRWHKVNIVGASVELQVERLPVSIAV